MTKKMTPNSEKTPSQNLYEANAFYRDADVTPRGGGRADMSTEWITAIDKRPCSRSEADVEAIVERLRRVAALSRLPPYVLQQLANAGIYEDIEKGVTIYKEGDGGLCWYTVLSGTLVGIRKIDSQHQGGVGYVSAGEAFGDCVTEQTRDRTIHTKTTCELFRVSNRDVHQIWEKHKDSMTELFGNSKLKNGYGNKANNHPLPSGKNKQTMAEPPNPAAPILEAASSQMLHVGWVLRTLLASRSIGTGGDFVLQDRKFHGRVIRRCASGAELVGWMLRKAEDCSRPQAAAMFQALVEEGVMAHISREFEFRDNRDLMYQFCVDMEGAPPLASPTAEDITEAELCLSDCLILLNKRGADAILRLILRKPSNARTPDELFMIYEELVHISALAHLSDSIKKELASIIMFEAHTRAGTVLFEQGDEGQCWYIILRGSVDVVIHGKGAVAVLQEGDDFGKLALVNSSPRAATIVLRENNCHFLRVDKQHFNRILKDVEANTVRLQEHGEDVLVLEKLGQGGKFPYGVMAGTAEKVIEHILETRLDAHVGGVGGKNSVPSVSASGDHLLDDFLLTYPVFITTEHLVQLLARHYHVATPSQDRDYLILSKKRVVRFAHRWVVTVRQTVFDSPEARKFLEDLTTDVENEVTLFPSLEEESSLVHHLTTRLSRSKEAATARKDVKWKLPPTGQPVTLFSGPSSPHRLSIKPFDDIIFRVYCADHTYCTLRVLMESTSQEIKLAAADRLKLKGDDLTLAEVKSNGERIPIGDEEPNVATGLSLNGRVFVTPRDHIDALTIVPEQEQATEATDYDIELFSTKELAYHMTIFDWELFWCVHEHELLFHVLGKHRFGGLTANLEVFLRRFTEIQFWVATEILSTTGLGKRVTLLKKMIKLASYCKDYQNLNGFLAIVMGLSNAAVSRLSLTWEKLPGKFRKMFTEFELLMDPLRNYRAYRVAVGKLQPPVLPFMPLLIKDMQLVHESHKTFEDGLVNFEKMHMLAATLRTLRHARARHLVLEPPSPKSETAVRAYVSCLRAIDNQKQLTSMSHKLEPRRS